MAATITPLPTLTARIDDRSMAQKLEALAKANEVRTRHARMKEEVRLPRPHGAIRAAELVRALPADLRTMRVRDLLMAVTGVGAGSCRQTLVALGTTGVARFEDLTPRQLGVLAHRLDEIAERQEFRRLEREQVAA